MMVRQIRGRRYDTKTAKEAVRVPAGGPDASSRYETRLYRKNSGEFFLYVTGKGAPHGDEITPLSYEKAREWVADNIDEETFDAMFGSGPDGEKRTISLSLTSGCIRRLKMLAAERDVSMSSEVERLIMEA